jgi:hypothetical protein
MMIVLYEFKEIYSFHSNEIIFLFQISVLHNIIISNFLMYPNYQPKFIIYSEKEPKHHNNCYEAFSITILSVLTLTTLQSI